MMNKLGNTDWVAELIPSLDARKVQFMVDTEEVDDELVEVFIDELVRLTGELMQGVAEQRMEMVRMAAHSIKGMGGTIGLPEISVLGLEIENTVKEERISDATLLIEGLAKWMKTLR
jgi:HPt (histidine-containing phosphotransfer) domain-containing protein